MKALVVGGGTFGLATALALAERGWTVEVLDQGRLPHPLAASTDISKVCRMEYGTDEAYMAWMEDARRGWLAWNEERTASGLEPLYHEDGVLMVCLGNMEPGGFEYESYRLLVSRGHEPERIGGEKLSHRFPAWSESFRDGFYHRRGGFAESGRVISALADKARVIGVGIREETPVAGLVRGAGSITGIEGPTGSFEADHVVLACGSWCAELLPELSSSLRRSYHPVWHLAPRRPELFAAERFPTFTADVARTGFYGFPLHPSEGVVKIGHHGIGLPSPADGVLEVPADKTARLFDFLAENLPALADAEVVSTRLCPYCDTPDEDFWIARHPDLKGLTVASGGSGHGFKFAPVLGATIADTVEGTFHPLAEKFRWRPEIRLERGREAARCHDRVL